MYWKLTCEGARAEDLPETPAEGRFVIHRHCDAAGPHLDLRLECGDYLNGWRIDASELDAALWAEEKAPHPTAWLERDGDAIRADHGAYRWVERNRDRRVLVLEGEHGLTKITAERVATLAPNAAAAVHETLRAQDLGDNEAVQLITDGLTSRRRALERLCGLGRELDGDAFDDALWRKAMRTCSLDELNRQLRSFELRFDQKYPPQPVSQPQPLPDDSSETRGESILDLVRD
jgi:hypothetical protein